MQIKRLKGGVREKLIKQSNKHDRETHNMINKLLTIYYQMNYLQLDDYNINVVF